MISNIDLNVSIKVDVKLLKRQRMALLRAVNNAHVSTGDRILLDGLQNLLDLVYDESEGLILHSVRG